MRFTVVLVTAFFAAATAGADVRMAVKRDGTKVIYNVGGSPRGARGADLKWLARKHDRRSRYDPIIERYAAKYDIDPVLIRAVIQVESDFNPQCVSHKGARGLMQLMPGTARRYGVAKIHDPEENIHGGIQYLAYLIRLFNGDLTRALAGYNAGENAVIRYGGVPPYEETSAYVKRALTVYYGRPHGAAISFAGGRGPNSLKGGFGRPAPPSTRRASRTKAVVQPVAAAMLPGVKILGTH
jgi:soluble lytic murein transglycosylase-like protein